MRCGEMRKIDIHCHTTNRKVPDVIPESATTEAILEEMINHDIETTVLLATYFPHKGTGVSNFRLYDWIRGRENDFCMFGSLDFEHYFYQGLNELEELVERAIIKGVKIYTGYQNIDLHSDKFKQIIDLVKNYDMPLMFHTGQSYTSKRKYGKLAITEVAKPTDLEFIAADYGVQVIMSHMGKPFFKELIEVVKRNENMYADMSGLIDSKFDRDEKFLMVEEIKRFLGECGVKQFLFGTDFPVQTHKDSVYFIEASMKGYTDKEKQAVYYDNARRLLK